MDIFWCTYVCISLIYLLGGVLKACVHSALEDTAEQFVKVVVSIHSNM